MSALTWPTALWVCAQARSKTFKCVTVGALAALAGLIWQFATVTRTYHGDWTALYCFGDSRPLPNQLQGVYRFKGSAGFDGQAYLMIALDPAFQRGTPSYVDEPDLRYRRILLPVLAYTVALGHPAVIPYSYLIANLGFLFLGAWWMSRYAVACFRHPAWGLMFLMIPCVLISLDRQTVDMALASLVVGTTYFWRVRRWPAFFVLLTLTCLVRETGILVAAAFFISFVIRRQWHRAALCLAATVPFFGWSWWIALHFPLTLRDWIPTHPYRWTLQGLRHPTPLAFPAAVQFVVSCFDVVSFCGFVLAVILSVRACWRNPATPPRLVALFSAALCVYLFSLDDWLHVYDYGRLASPMLASLLLTERSPFARVNWFPCALMTSRVVVQLAPQVLMVLGISPS